MSLEVLDTFTTYCRCVSKLPIIYNIKNMTPEEKARIKIDQWLADYQEKEELYFREQMILSDERVQYIPQ